MPKDILSSIGGVIVTDLTGLLSGGAVPQLAETLVADVLGAGDAVGELTAFLQTQVDATEGHASARGFARATLKPVENAMSPQHGKRPGGVTAEQQAQIGVGLGQNVNLAFAACGQTYVDMINAQAALEVARGTAGEDAARVLREDGEAAYQAALRNVLHAAQGAPLETVAQISVEAPKG